LKLLISKKKLLDSEKRIAELENQLKDVGNSENSQKVKEAKKQAKKVLLDELQGQITKQKHQIDETSKKKMLILPSNLMNSKAKFPNKKTNLIKLK